MVERVGASPWPLFVAVGLAVAEAGVLFGVFAVAVAGVCCFGGAVAGLVAESDHVASRPRGLLAVAAPLAVLGGVVVAATTYETRGSAVLVGAGLLVALAAVDAIWATSASR